MTAELRLVVDNSVRADAADRIQVVSRSSTSEPRTSEFRTSEAGAVVARAHRFWAPRARLRPTVSSRLLLPLRGDRGAVTAEYAIIIMAGVAFAGLLVAIMRSGEIRQMLVDLVQNALGSAG